MATVEPLNELAVICEAVDLRAGFTLPDLMTVHDICKSVQSTYPEYPAIMTPALLKTMKYYSGYTIDMLAYASIEAAKKRQPAKLHALLSLIAERAALCIRHKLYLTPNINWK